MDQQAPPQGVDPNGVPNFRAFATQVQLRDAAARNFSTSKDQLTYGKDRLGKYTIYSQYDPPTPDLSGEDQFGRTRFATSDGNVNSLVMVDSRYRDRQAYPQPTFFTLRLPRIYKQVANITLSDLKLLTSFYFFRNSKGNTDITVYEKDRTTLTYEGIIQSTIVKRYITTGSYNIDSLLQEIQLQLNYTPLFFDYVNGFNDFIGLFRASGDYALNFNKPGDYFFNNTTNLWVPNPTVDTITLHFWKTRYAGLTTYSVDQVLIAYYYPVLNEYLYDENFNNKDLNLQAGIGIDPAITTIEQVIQRILYNFQGITPPDPVVLAVIKASRPELDRYRLNHTFRYWLINKYIVSRDTRSQNVYITSPSLNTSLINLLNSQQAIYFGRALQIQGIDARQYAAIQSNVDRALAVLQSMYSYEQTQFLTYFGVPWSQYTLSYYANLGNSILLRNGLNAVGIPANDSEAVDAGIIPLSNDILNTQSSNPAYYWPNLSNVYNQYGQLASTISLVNLSSISTTQSSYQYVYSMDQSNFLSNYTIVNPTTGYLYSDFLVQSGNAVCPIQSGKYTVFKFRSPVRQTMQVETLPRPTVYRVPAYNKANFDSNINYYFDISYSFVFTSNDPYVPSDPDYTYAYDNLPSTNLFQIPGWSPANAPLASPAYSWGTSYTSSLSSYTRNVTLDILSYNRSLYATFTTPQFSTIAPNSSFTYSINLATTFFASPSNTSTLTMPQQPFRMFLYHDRAAFQGDVIFNRNENPRFYKMSTVITDVSGTLSFTTYPNQQYYISLRADSSNFGTAYVKVTPYFNSSFATTQQTLSIEGINPETDVALPYFNSLIQSNFNYAQLYDSNWIRLPIQSNLWTPDPTGDPINQNFVISNVPIGYDEQGVSTDYTDYVPYILNSSTFSYFPSSNLGIDPITKYQFQSNSPYNTSTNTFLYADGLNSIFTPGLQDVYNPSLVASRQFKIVHYYSPTYIAESTSNYPLGPTLISGANTAQQPYNISTTSASTIGGYEYSGQTSTLGLQYGPLGFSFIPEEGVWDIKRMVFRSAIQDYDNDPNQVIQYLAVYNLGTILNAQTVNLTMSTALAVLSNTARVTYTSTFTLSNNGFDTKGGTYYEFQKDTSFVSQVSSYVLGYPQVPGQMSAQPESMYTCIAFDQYGTPTPIKALSGSAVPYPFYNNAYVSSAYLDGTPNYNTNQGLIFPSTIGPTAFPFIGSASTLFAPPSGASQETQSKFALSIPVGTSVLPIKQGIPLASTAQYLVPWTTTLTPTNVVATVSNYILMQDTNINIYNYEQLPTTRVFGDPAWQLSADQIFPPYELTPLMGISGNSTYFYFMGFSNDGAGFYSLRFKRYNPRLGILYEYITDGTFKVPEGGTLRGFVINDNEQITVSYQDTTNTTKLYYNIQPSTSMTSQTVPGFSTATISICPFSSTLYWMPLNAANQGRTVFSFPLSPASVFPGTQYTPVGASLPSTWTYLAVNSAASVPATNDRIWLASQQTGYESNVYCTTSWNVSLSQWNTTQLSTSITNLSNQGQPIASIVNGYNGGFWVTALNQPRVWGNRNSTPDLNGTVGTAWQIFYPWQKIVLEKVANNYNPIVDLNYLTYPEYPHTAMFYYRDESKFTQDTKFKWGLESSSNFVVADTNLSGYYFNSYIFNVPLVKSVGPTDYQYLTVRGYTPTENSETLIRFNLPNVYSFGYATQNDMIFEIALYSTNQTLFNSNYGFVLSNFDTAFQQSNSFFGQGLIPNFDGSNYNTSNFRGFASNVSTLYAGYQSNAGVISSITGYVNSNIQLYISTNLQYIIPASAQGRANYLDPIIFSLLWKSGLLPQYKNLLEDWGLGYNLGYAKEDTPFSTYHRASSFYKILEDYIFLRLNPQYQMNRMDNTFRENFKITRDPTGQVQNFHGKLLLNNFNTFSQTFIFNNQPFNPPIGRLDQLYFQWVNIVGDQIDNNDCDWSATCVISEAKSSATAASTLPALPPMPPIRK
jgi:hypothetical protein